LNDTPRALKIEPALSQAVLTDIEEGGAKDALPLLAFTLERLYADYGGDGNLKLSEYEELGRIKGSIEAAVESALQAADNVPSIPKDRAMRLALLRRGLIPAIASVDPETRSPRRRVARKSEIPAESLPLIELLVEQRLLVSDIARDAGESTIEPAHEALLRQWSELEGWLKDDFAVLATLEGVKRASHEWNAKERNADWLAHGGTRLADAEALERREDMASHLGVIDRLYIAQCRKHETERQEKLRANLSSALTALAFVELEQRPVDAAKLALAAWPRERAMDLPKRDVTMNAVSRSLAGLHERMRIATDAPIYSVAFSPDGARVLTGSRDNTARLWDAATGKEIRAFTGHEDIISSVAFSPDGARVLTGSW
ncbi:MAG: WD40 repeat domain-containing protein, partial [Methylocella sp.]